MLPDPLHPAIIHFPLVLMFLVPLAGVAALWVIRRGTDERRAWAIPLLLTAALAASAFLAVRTGEADEERVEDVVSEAAIHTHEEAAEQFLMLSGILALIAAAGLVRGDLGRAARALTIAGSLGVVAAGVQVGAAGGDLVYRYDAASVYIDAGSDQARALPEQSDDED